ncbi:MAG: glycosyltransferase family 39 protein [Desulfobacterales bacterium]|nr:glycosyltransferase family 39 protein [Desulfobacterales bacterium]
MKLNISNLGFIVILVVLNLGLAFYATPITNLGDANAYILLSKSFLGENINVNLQYRSPLFSIVMAGFMIIFKAPFLYKIMIVFQYLLVAVTAWLVYQIFLRLFIKREMAMLVALMFNLSLSTIYYANILLTETLTVFLLVLSVFLLLRVFDQNSMNRIFSLGTVIGLLILARFNAIPIFITFFILLGYILFVQKNSMIKWISSMMGFIFAFALIVNLWCIYNFQHNGFYGIFPNAKLSIPKNPRNITIASIRPGDIVSEVNKPVLEIILKAREKYLNREKKVRKGSFSGLDKNEVLSGLYSGYAIYNMAYPKLQAYYKLQKNNDKSKKIPGFNDFLNEIFAQKRKYFWKYRFYSLLSGFRAAGHTLPEKYGNLNFNILPSIILKAYKLAFLFMSFFILLAFFFFIVSTIKARFKPDVTLLTMFFLVFSFWGVNFLFVTVNDANRFKFPVEPLIIGLFVYYSHGFIRRLMVGKTRWKLIVNSMSEKIKHFLRNYEKRTLLFFFILTLILKIIYVVIYFHSAGTTNWSDDWQYLSMGKQIADGNWSPVMKSLPFMIVAPMIPVLIALFTKIFGSAFFSFLLYNILITSLVVIVLFYLGKEIFHRKVGWALAFWGVFNLEYFRYNPHFLKEATVFLFLPLTLLFLVKSIGHKSNVKFLIIASFSFAWLIHSDERFVVYFPFLSLILFMSKPIKKAIQSIGLWIGFVLLLMLPWGIRNYLVFDQIVIISPRTTAFTSKIWGKNLSKLSFSTDLKLDDAKYKRALLFGSEHGITPRAFRKNEKYIRAFINFWQPAYFKAEYIQFGFRPQKWSMAHNVFSLLFYGIFLPFYLIGLVVLLKKKYVLGIFIAMIPILHSLLHAYMIWPLERYRSPINFIVVMIGIWTITVFRENMTKKNVPIGGTPLIASQWKKKESF